MDEGFLLATQLSSFSPAQSTSIPVQTTRQNIPLPPNPQESDPPVEHATFSFVLHTVTTGTILLRLLHGGLIIELVPLSSQVLPIRFVFPAVILPLPGIFLADPSELQILAVTNTGSLYRITIPIHGRDLWKDQMDSIWPREHFIANFSEDVKLGIVHAQGPHCIVISMSNSSMLRLEADSIGNEGHYGWNETILQHGSFLSSLASYIPTLHSGIPGASEIVSVATHPWPTDIGHIWTLSRDRTLRLWKAKLGCVASKILPSTMTGRESSPGLGNSGPVPQQHLLLSAEHRRLLRVFSSHSQDERIFVLAFIPTISSSTSGGAFHLFDTFSGQLNEVGVIDCSANTAYCHLQDFNVINNTLYTLWDKQGRSTLERMDFPTEISGDGDFEPGPWRTASYGYEPELTPVFMEEKLLSPGSLTEHFLNAIMRPGVFSPFTLRTATEQYIDACLSLPGPPPTQLTTIYANVEETIAAVVGCTVTLNRDPQTGNLLHANYWTALKRDWEGFVARCREVERSARWPLVLGFDHTENDVIIVERERVGLLLNEDLPIHLRRLINREQPLEEHYNLMGILWTLRNKLGPKMMSVLEACVGEILHQEIAFSFADILQDQARRIKFQDQLDGGSVSWLIGRLQSVDDLDAAARTALDVIGGFDAEIKKEDDDMGLFLPSPVSDWTRSVTAAYISTSIEARYDLCLSLVTLLFFISQELSEWDPSLLAEVFAVFRGVAMLRLVAEQPTGEKPASVFADTDTDSPDDVVTQMRKMNMSNNKSHFVPRFSLIHILLAQSGGVDGPSIEAHKFLDSTGLLQSVSPGHATRSEILFCERLRLLGFYEVARELLTWLPRTPGAIYVQARVWLDIGRPDDASLLMEKIAGSFGPYNALSAEDQDALTCVLPGGQLFDSEFTFYVYASNIFKNSNLVQQEVLFARYSISVATPDVDTSPLWLNVIKGSIDLGLYEDAYAALMSTPYDKQKREYASLLAIRMCESDAIEKLMEFDFAGISDEVEAALSFKARNIDPRIRPRYSKILYTWYIQKGDYRNASLTMYQHARKIQNIITNATLFATLAEEQLDALSIAINALSLVDQKTSWVVMPDTVGATHESRKRQKLSKHIPEEKYTAGKYDAEIVHLADMQYDYALLLAQIEIIKKEPTLLSTPEFLLPPPLIVMRLAQANYFSAAMSTARSLDIDMTDLFIHLTHQCLRLSRNPEVVLQEDTSDWLLTDKTSSWSGNSADRGWRYLRQALEQHDNADSNYRYTKAALETILSVDISSHPPPWLVQTLENHHYEYLIRTSLRYENLEDAVNYTCSLIKSSDTKLAREAPKNASSTWLPYTLIDQVLVAANSQDKPPARLSELRTEISNRINRVQKQSQFLH